MAPLEASSPWWNDTQTSSTSRPTSQTSDLLTSVKEQGSVRDGLSGSKWAPEGKRSVSSGLIVSDTKSDYATEYDSDDSMKFEDSFIIDPVLAQELRAKRDAGLLGQTEQTAAWTESGEGMKTEPAEPPDNDKLVPVSVQSAHSNSHSQSLDGLEVDDDGDVVMRDLEGWEVVKEVADAIAEDRASDKIGGGEAKILTPGQRVEDATHVIVIDTSFIISHLSLVNELVLSYMEWGCTVVLPWATIQELDGLKKARRGIHAAGDGRDVDISKLARAANRWAFKALGKPEPGIWGQTKEEALDPTFDHGDMAILDCARFFYDQGYDTVLLTNDHNLSVKALIYKIRAFTYESGQTGHSILKKIYGRSHRPRFLPKPQGFVNRAVEPNVELGVKAKLEPATLEPSLAAYPRISPRPTIPPGTSVSPGASLRPDCEVVSNCSNSNSMNESIHCPRYVRPGSLRSHAIPIVNPTDCPVAPTLPTSALAPHTSTPWTRRVGDNLGNLLHEIQNEAISHLMLPIKQHLMRCFGDQAALEHLQIRPDEQIRTIYTLEDFIHRHYQAVFCEMLPRPMDRDLTNHKLGQTYTRLDNWARGVGATTPLTNSEVLDFIESLNAIWTKIVVDFTQLQANNRLMDQWRTRVRNSGLYI